jgi:hypothetical protein
MLLSLCIQCCCLCSLLLLFGASVMACATAVSPRNAKEMSTTCDLQVNSIHVVIAPWVLTQQQGLSASGWVVLAADHDLGIEGAQGQETEAEAGHVAEGGAQNPSGGKCFVVVLINNPDLYSFCRRPPQGKEARWLGCRASTSNRWLIGSGCHAG